jgi:hypothetical protein
MGRRRHLQQFGIKFDKSSSRDEVKTMPEPEPDKRPEVPGQVQQPAQVQVQQRVRGIEQLSESDAKLADLLQRLEEKLAAPGRAAPEVTITSYLQAGDLVSAIDPRDEGTEEDWLLVREEVLKRIHADRLDTPEAHLAYVRARLKSVYHV